MEFRIYTWNNSNWDETKITASDGDDLDNYGYSISMSADGNSFIVGHDDFHYDIGSVYV